MKGYYVSEDSRTLKDDIIRWAIEFLAKEPSEDDDEDWDYMDAIENFAIEKMTEEYGVMIDFAVEFKGLGFISVKAKTADEARKIACEMIMSAKVIPHPNTVSPIEE